MAAHKAMDLQIRDKPRDGPRTGSHLTEPAADARKCWEMV